MTRKFRLGCAAVIVKLFIGMPIFFYLAWQILDRVGATDLMWFLYWAYIPVTFVSAILATLIEGVEE